MHGLDIDATLDGLFHQSTVPVGLPRQVKPVGATCHEAAGRSGLIVAVRAHDQTGRRLTPDRPPIILT